MKTIRLDVCFAVVVFWMLALALPAQRPHIYTINEGMSSSHINSITVDSKGFLWLSGENSLDVFDGTRFHNIKKNDEKGESLFYTANQVSEIGDGLFWLATSNGLFLYDRNKNNFRWTRLGEQEPNPGYSISHIANMPDSTHILFFSVGYGVYLYDMNKNAVDSILTQRYNAAVNSPLVGTSLIDSDGNLWIVTDRNEVKRICTKDIKVLPMVVTAAAASILAEGSVFDICEDPVTGNMLLGTSKNGVLVYDRKTNMLRPARTPSQLNVSAILIRKNGDVVVGSDGNGLWRFDRESESLKVWQLDKANLNTDKGKVHCLREDADGNLLVALYMKGLLVVPCSTPPFCYHSVAEENQIDNSTCITTLCRDAEGVYWIGTDGCGMFSSSDCGLTHISQVESPRDIEVVTSTCIDNEGSLWVGTYGKGLWKKENGTFVIPDYLKHLRDQMIMAVVCDPKTGYLYVGTNGGGLFVVDTKNGTCQTPPDILLFNPWVNALYIDGKRNLWVGSAGSMVYYNIDTRKTERIEFDGITSALFYSMAQKDGKLYMGSNKGLLVYDYKTKEMAVINQSNGLLDSNVKAVAVLGDDIWMSSINGISRLDVKSGDIINYPSIGDNYVGEFSKGSVLVSDNGRVLFGADNGIVSFWAEKVKQENRKAPEVYFTDLFVGSDEVIYYNTPSSRNILDADISVATRITLPFVKNSFTIDFSAPEMSLQRYIIYKYTLEGYEDVWHTALKGSPRAYYASLRPGKYKLKVKAMYLNHEELSSERIIDVIVEHPWYTSIWARIIYCLLALALCFAIYRIRREKQLNKLRLDRVKQNEMMKEAKLRMFTSIVHELRTPLIMIVSPLKQLRSQETDQGHINLYNVMQRNCDRLLGIVKQLTDVRRIDNGQFRLHFKEVDFGCYVSDIIDSFSGMAVVKRIDLDIDLQDGGRKVWVDPVHFEKIIVNLLSNAFKFTPDEGCVRVSTTVAHNDDGSFKDSRIKEYLVCKVYNSGSHIDEKEISHVWERFYRSSNATDTYGSGIGLNLVYELTHLHHATIDVANAVPHGVVFSLKLPLGCKHLSKAEMEQATDRHNEKAFEETRIENLEKDIKTQNSLENDDTVELKSKRTLLIVDDDMQIVEYMRSELGNDYNVLVAFSGNSAWKTVLANRPDVVVTDLMMPDGDGHELAVNIKSNPETEIIPVIMLTAENSEEVKLKSIDLHVDYFLEKPFNMEMLRKVIKQTLHTRDAMLNKMRRMDVGSKYEDVTMESADDKLFKRISDSVKKHLDDSEFSVVTLADEVGLSRVHLNRKMKERYGVSPSVYIKTYRLKQAAYLLVNNKVNVSEVAYSVGFSSHSYFSNSFHEFFGMSPKEFVAHYSEEINEEALKKLLE